MDLLRSKGLSQCLEESEYECSVLSFFLFSIVFVCEETEVQERGKWFLKRHRYVRDPGHKHISDLTCQVLYSTALQSSAFILTLRPKHLM